MEKVIEEYSEFEKLIKAETGLLKGSRIGPRCDGHQGNVSIEKEVVGFYCLYRGSLHFWFMDKDTGSPQTEPPAKTYTFCSNGWTELASQQNVFDSTHLARQFMRMLIGACELAPDAKTEYEIRLERTWNLLGLENFDEVEEDQLTFMLDHRLIKRTDSGFQATDEALMQRLSNTKFPGYYIYDGWNLEFCYNRTKQAVC